jgi:hypothetical protein
MAAVCACLGADQDTISKHIYIYIDCVDSDLAQCTQSAEAYRTREEFLKFAAKSCCFSRLLKLRYFPYVDLSFLPPSTELEGQCVLELMNGITNPEVPPHLIITFF